MKTIIQITAVVASVVFISGCATHNTPDLAIPNFNSGNQVEVFVDQDGTFYPEDWKETYGKPCRLNCMGKSYSLRRRTAGESGLMKLEQAEKEIVESIGHFLKDKKRVFILIHGFNNDVRDAREYYGKIEENIALKPDDAVVKFYWDGLVGKGIGPASIWFKSTGYSQLAGERGLRDVLNAMSDKEIILITHSRGTSVVLSALSNPPYDPDFENATCWVDVNNNVPLKENGNEMRAIFLASAIGCIDFKTPDLSGYRDFSKQLEGIVYTVNPNDPTLSKLILKSNDFNPTDFGLKKSVGEKLNEHYGNMTPTMISDLDKHGFSSYVAHDTFKEMLVACGVDVNE